MQVTTNKYSRYMPFVAAGFAAGTIGAAAAFVTYRFLRQSKPLVAPHVEANLPIAKNLKTIPDVQGNYDIDGVSFDSEGVVVSSDETKTETKTDTKPTVINPS